LAKKLAVFGFTLNQARVYLAVVEAGSVSVGRIAQKSRLYRQDIYKILPNLEKKGVITRSLGVPVTVRAIPVKTALRNLVASERKKALDMVKRMEADLNEISNAISTLYDKSTENEESHFSFLTKEAEVKNRADLIFKKAKIDCSVVSSIELLTKRAEPFRERFQNATDNGAEIRLVIECRNSERSIIGSTVEKVRPKKGAFSAKLVICESPKPFQVIDRKEVWISTARKQQPSGFPCVLWSNGKNIVEAYLERFDRIWNDHNAAVLN
jgi:sugar-specific transcriptional regulator TrmB